MPKITEYPPEVREYLDEHPDIEAAIEGQKILYGNAVFKTHYMKGTNLLMNIELLTPQEAMEYFKKEKMI